MVLWIDPVPQEWAGALDDILDRQAQVEVVLCSDYLDLSLPRVAGRMHDEGKTWVLLARIGAQFCLGPRFARRVPSGFGRRARRALRRV